MASCRPKMHSLRALRLLPLAAASGCATVVHGSSQNVTVITEPAGAVCVLRRDNEVVGVIDPTPGTLSLMKSRKPVELTCKKDGFAEARGSFDSEFVPISLANVILGGVIGVVVDASSGAATEYKPEVQLTLTPLNTPGGDEGSASLETNTRAASHSTGRDS